MRTRVILTAVCLSALAALAAGPALGGEDAASDLARCRKLVDQGKWKQAVEAYSTLFADYPRDPLLVGEIEAIEDDLKRALFGLDYTEPGASDLFGPGTRRYGKASGKVILEFEGKPTGPRWVDGPSGVKILDLRFQDKLSVKLYTAMEDLRGRGIAVLLCYDIEKQGGYVVSIAASSKAIAYAIDRLDQGAKTRLQRNDFLLDATWVQYEVRRQSTGIEVLLQNRIVSRAVDKTYRGGFLAFAGGFPDKVTVSGCLDRNFQKQLVSGIRDRAFREWQEKQYSRDKVLPDWALHPVVSSSAVSIAALPSDAGKGDRARITGLVEKCLMGEPEAAESLGRLAEKQPSRTRTWLASLSVLGLGRLKAAEAGLSLLLAEEPEFAPALAIRGMLRLQLRRTEEAEKDLAAAREKDPKLPIAWLGEVNLAIYEGDLERARKAVEEARSAGAMSTELADMPGLLHRALKGPLWPKKHEVMTTHFETKSDHSRDLCREACHLLEAALQSYANYFPDVEIPEKKARVYIFASRDGYLGYAVDRKRNLTHSSGMYDPSLRELLVYLPDKRTEFVHTVRHEGFHRFLHEHLDAAPLWFNEGCAEYFASARDSMGGALIPGAPYKDALEFLEPRLEQLPPLDELFTADNRTFMQKAGVYYPQSWAVVHYLLQSTPTMKTLFKDYFQSLQEGLSREEAYEEHLEPVLRSIENGYKSHLRTLLSE